MQQFNTMILEMEFYNIAVVDDICTITNTVSGKTTIVVIDLHTESLMHVSYTDSTDSSEVELKANVDNYSIPEIPTNID